MAYIYSIKKTIRRYLIYIILSLCLLSNSIAFIPSGRIFYIFALAIIGVYSILNNRNKSSKIGYIVFITICFISCLINNVWDIRLFIFSLILIALTPITNSYKIFCFRGKMLYTFLMIFPFISVAALYCYFAGINMGANLEDGSFHDFAAFFSISISLATAIGISNIVIGWLLLQAPNKILKIFYIILLLLSLFISIVAASRAALVSSIITLLFLMIVAAKNIKQVILRLIVIAALVTTTVPFYLPYTEKIQNKFESSKGKEYGSRTGIWQPSIEAFKKSPIFGFGFAVSYREQGKMVGRVESGSGWLSILFQTGIVGMICVLCILKNLKKTSHYLKKDQHLLLFFSVFIYMCFHSLFEGYILTSMVYMSFLFWMLLGYLHVYPTYAKLIIINKKYE